MPGVDTSSLEQAYLDVRDNENPTNWALCCYSGKDIVLECTGEDYKDLLSKLAEDNRMYAYARFQIGDDYSKTFKFVFITWIGSAVRPLDKAAVSGDKAFVKDVFKIFSKEILTTDKHDLDEHRLKATL